MAHSGLSSRRFNQGLRALSDSIGQARAAASSIAAGEIVTVRTKDIPKVALAEVVDVTWQSSRSATVSLPLDAKDRILVRGNNLEDVKELTLVGPGVIKFRNLQLTRALKRTDYDEIEAEPVIDDPKPGRYAAKVTNKDGRTATLLDASIIEAAPEQEAGEVDLGELLPNVGFEASEFPAALIVLNGEPDRFYFTDPWENPVRDMKARRIDRDIMLRDHATDLAKFEQALERLHPNSDVIFLLISIPDFKELPPREEPDYIFKEKYQALGFLFFARSSKDDSVDRLTFTVLAGK